MPGVTLAVTRNLDFYFEYVFQEVRHSGAQSFTTLENGVQLLLHWHFWRELTRVGCVEHGTPRNGALREPVFPRGGDPEVLNPLRNAPFSGRGSLHAP